MRPSSGTGASFGVFFTFVLLGLVHVALYFRRRYFEGSGAAIEATGNR